MHFWYLNNFSRGQTNYWPQCTLHTGGQSLLHYFPQNIPIKLEGICISCSLQSQGNIKKVSHGGKPIIGLNAPWTLGGSLLHYFPRNIPLKWKEYAFLLSWQTFKETFLQWNASPYHWQSLRSHSEVKVGHHFKYSEWWYLISSLQIGY